MSLAEWPSGLAYLVVFLAAAVEGEVVFVAASALVGRGHLDPALVLVSGALGASAGDQFYYYALRGRLSRWLLRFPFIARRQTAVVSRVQRHATAMVLAVRFLPGLRIAIPAACAFSGVGPVRFTVLNLASAFAWALVIMLAVSRVGPGAVAFLGLHGWWAVLVPGVLILAFFHWLGRASRALEDGRGTRRSAGTTD